MYDTGAIFRRKMSGLRMFAGGSKARGAKKPRIIYYIQISGIEVFGLIQDIGNHVYDNSYHPVPPDDESFVLYYEGDKALVMQDGADITFPRVRDIISDNPAFRDDYIYLFKIDDERFYLANLHDFAVPGSLRADMIPVRTFRSATPGYLAFAGITGHQLCEWYESRRFCGRCAHPLRPDKKERMLYCEKCGLQEYPKITPAVIIAIKDGNRLLLTKYAHRQYTSYALVAGFCEIGETLEDTVRREVREELDLAVTNIRYYKSQPWSFSGTLLSGFYCDLARHDALHLEEDELALAQWFEREDLPVDSLAPGSLTQEMIVAFHEGRQ